MEFATSEVRKCTFKNVLWRTCIHHYSRVCTESKLSVRIGHLTLAIFETIPVIGQVISFIELKAPPCCIPSPQNDATLQPTPPLPVRQLSQETKNLVERLEPVSMIPKITIAISQENPFCVRLLWPQDLTCLGLTEESKALIDYHVKAAAECLSKGSYMTFEKKYLAYHTTGSEPVALKLPITLSILKRKPNSKKLHVLLFSKTILASGGERTVRLVYNLTTGDFLIKKRIAGCFEEYLLNQLKPLRKKRGLAASIMFRNSLSKKNKQKRQIIEPIRDGSLSILFQTAPLSHFFLKYSLIIDLLSDLQDLHNTPMSQISFSTTKRFDPDRKFDYKAFHADIKPDNVLVSYQNGKWRAELCDFGGSADPSIFMLSFGYTPPEYILFYMQHLPAGLSGAFSGPHNPIEVIAFNIKYAQSRDVWSMGLVLLSLLVERQDMTTWENTFHNCQRRAKIAPLPSLQKMLSGTLKNPYDENNVVFLGQDLLDKEMDDLAQDTLLIHPKRQEEVSRSFQIIKRMLRVNPDERITVHEALNLFKYLTTF